MADLKELTSVNSSGGQQKTYSHTSSACNCTMTFAIYLPPAVVNGTVSKVPVIYFLPGLNSTIRNSIARAAYPKYAAEKNLVVVISDSSPRDTGLPGEKRPSQESGPGASYYMDAITPGWKDHYKMFTYVTEELISVVESSFDFVLAGRRGLIGRSMGGMGALLCVLKRPDLYLSTSCFFPLCNASISSTTPYRTYLGTDKEVWKLWDPYELMLEYKGRPLELLVHIGTDDHYWKSLQVWQLVRGASGKNNINLSLKIRRGQGHTGAFVSSQIEYVMNYHANILNQ